MDLFSLSCKYRIPIILIVQSNRQGGESKNGPSIENIAESDAVAQNATRIVTMKREDRSLTINVAKNRYGDTGQPLLYDVDYGLNKYDLKVDVDIRTSFQKRNSEAKTLRGEYANVK